ncbi:hypothetical protein ARTHRO9AX_90081 [Arthrobacter sp. 9AX]|nr:hypothetical protein ARTHRO9AX_90081 [Arthrobacter sp. 9AX]
MRFRAERPGGARIEKAAPNGRQTCALSMPLPLTQRKVGIPGPSRDECQEDDRGYDFHRKSP